MRSVNFDLSISTISDSPLFTVSKKKGTLETWHNCLLGNWNRLLSQKGPGT